MLLALWNLIDRIESTAVEGRGLHPRDTVNLIDRIERLKAVAQLLYYTVLANLIDRIERPLRAHSRTTLSSWI